ncbi:hypothetical protein ATERTT37_006502 [Aspergillus terreus]
MYNPNDPLSFLSAWLALVPQALCVVYATLIWSSREAEVLLMFAGQMGCEALNFVLKRIIKEERPKRAAAVAISRIYLNYHTPRQVLAGCAAGIACALAWFCITGSLRAHGWIDWASDLEVARFFRLRDLVVTEDLTEAGWQRWEAKRKLRRRENSDYLAAKSK